MARSIENTVALVTGANGSVGQELVSALLARGATKVYAAGRDIGTVAIRERVVPLQLDVTSDNDVAAVVSVAGDLSLLINNAGTNHNTAFLRASHLEFAREELEVNYLGPLRLVRAFAPTLVANDGAVINVLAALAHVNFPYMGSYCASKAAALSLTQGLRGELRDQGVDVVAAIPGAIDTPMTAALDIPKMTSAEVAQELLDGFVQGQEDVYIGEMAKTLARDIRDDPKAVERQVAGWLKG